MDSDIFRLDPSLETFSGIALAISYWEREDVLQKIDHNFPQGKRFRYDSDENFTDIINNLSSFYEEWYKLSDDEIRVLLSGHKVIEHIFQQIEFLQYPEKLKKVIKSFVVKTGQKICYWIKHVTEVLKLDFEYAKKIYWTCYGEIDELKILQKFWLKDSKLRRIKCPSACCSMQNNLYCIASMYAQEDFISNHFIKMKNQILSVAPDLGKYKWTSSHITGTWISLCLIGKTFNKRSRFRAQHMFLECISLGLEFGVKYFWNQLTTNKQQSIVARGAIKCLSLADTTLNRDRKSKSGEPLLGRAKRRGTYYLGFKREIATRVLIFLINKMTEVQRIEFLKKYFYLVFRFFIQTWPYQEILSQPLLNSVCKHLSEKHKKKLLKELVYYVTINCKFSNSYPRMTRIKDPSLYVNTKKFYSNLFEILMERTTKISKESVLCNRFPKKHEKFYKCQYYDILNVVINDPDLKEYREKILNLGINHLAECIRKGDWSSLDKFFETVTMKKEEMKFLKDNLNLSHGFFMKGDISSAFKNLNWLGYSYEEQMKFKNELNAVEICSRLMALYKFETAEEFLILRFETAEERENVKKTLMSNNVPLNVIFKNWNSEDLVSLKISRSNSCLSWFFKSDEERENVKKKLISDNVPFEAILKIFPLNQPWGRHDDVAYSLKATEADSCLTWFFKFDQERENVKKTLISSNLPAKLIVGLWYRKYGYPFGKLSNAEKKTEADSCLNWFFKSDEERTKFKTSKLILNEDFIASHWESLSYRTEIFKNEDFLKFFLSSNEEFESLKNHMRNNLNWWIDTYGIKKAKVELIYRLVNWVFEDDEEGKKQFISNCINSFRGISLFVKVLENCSSVTSDYVKNWMIEARNFSAMKLYLDGLEGTEMAILNMKDILRSREEGLSFSEWEFISSKYNLNNRLLDSVYETDSCVGWRWEIDVDENGGSIRPNGDSRSWSPDSSADSASNFRKYVRSWY